MALDAQWRQLHTSNHMLSERAMVHSRLADWKTTTLGNCSVWYSGGTPDTSVDAYWNGDIPWITASSLHRFYLDDSERKITQTGLENGSRLMPANSIIFVVRGMSLKTEFRVGITKRSVAFGQDCKAIVAKEEIDPLYLANVLRAKANDILKMVDEAGHGTGRLQTDTLKALEIPLPPFPEQRAIASILGALDDKIELNRRMNATLEAMARAIFRSWFVDFDPVRTKAERRETGLPAEIAALFPDGFVESELGGIPRSWKITEIKNIAVVGSGKRPVTRSTSAGEGTAFPLWGGNGPMGFVPEPLVTEPILLTGRVGTLGSVFRITEPCWPSDNTLILKPMIGPNVKTTNCRN